MPRIQTEITTEITEEVWVDFEVWCSHCGAGLCRQTDVNGEDVEVEPCQNCLRGAEDEAREEAYSEGYDDGFNRGYEKARQELREEGLLSGLGPSGEKVCMSR